MQPTMTARADKLPLRDALTPSPPTIGLPLGVTMAAVDMSAASTLLLSTTMFQPSYRAFAISKCQAAQTQPLPITTRLQTLRTARACILAARMQACRTMTLRPRWRAESAWSTFSAARTRPLITTTQPTRRTTAHALYLAAQTRAPPTIRPQQPSTTEHAPSPRPVVSSQPLPACRPNQRRMYCKRSRSLQRRALAGFSPPAAWTRSPSTSGQATRHTRSAAMTSLAASTQRLVTTFRVLRGTDRRARACTVPVSQAALPQRMLSTLIPLPPCSRGAVGASGAALTSLPAIMSHSPLFIYMLSASTIGQAAPTPPHSTLTRQRPSRLRAVTPSMAA